MITWLQELIHFSSVLHSIAFRRFCTFKHSINTSDLFEAILIDSNYYLYHLYLSKFKGFKKMYRRRDMMLHFTTHEFIRCIIDLEPNENFACTFPRGDTYINLELIWQKNSRRLPEIQKIKLSPEKPTKIPIKRCRSSIIIRRSDSAKS